jgi:tetratricopeptide (TPR) repeat protein
MVVMPRTRRSLAPTLLLVAFGLVPGWVAQAGCAAGSDAPREPAAAESAGEALPARAFELHTRGFAALENEQPVDAEAAYEELTEVAPADPLPWANLAVAQLRQQKTEDALASVGQALQRVDAQSGEGGAPAGAVHAIQGAVLDWVGRSEDALAAYRAAAEAAPGDPETLYSLYRLEDPDRRAADAVIAEWARQRWLTHVRENG